MKKRVGSILKLCLSWALVAATVVGCFVVLEYSLFSPGLTKHLQNMAKPIVLLNIATLGILWVALLILFNRLWVSCTVLVAFCGLLAVVNFFVAKYHTMPLSFLSVGNLTTALNVIEGGYSFSLEPRVTNMLMMTGAMLVASLLVGVITREKGLHGRKRWLRNSVLVVVSAVMFYAGYLAPQPIKPQKTLAWSWQVSYDKYGYVASTVESGFQLYRTVNQPEEYSQQAMDRMSQQMVSTKGEANKTPDIILILNESFFDLQQVIDMETDIPFLPNMDEMDNLLKGYAFVQAGGSTNAAEYELLSSNSMRLMPGITPFNVLNLKGANSIVSHLSALGYRTLGTHVEPAANYSRAVAYPALGFDTSNFEDAYTDTENYGDRMWFQTDETVYRNCLRWYNEEMGQDEPRFLYVLTIQNHGAYESNPPEYDTVHVLGDFGDLEDDLNEYLSCLRLSDRAFKDLTSALSEVDRPVIVCMVGDHAPVFYKDLPFAIDQEEQSYRKLRVPLFIWANYPLKQRELGTMSMNMVVPTLLDIAEVRLSPYYDYMLALKADVPILGASDKYYDAHENAYAYASDTGAPYERLVDEYFYLEYQNIKTNKNRQMYMPYP